MNAVDFTCDGNLVVTSQSIKSKKNDFDVKHRIKVWNAFTGSLITVIKAHTAAVSKQIRLPNCLRFDILTFNKSDKTYPKLRLSHT